MINKIKRYLLKTLHITEFKENTSGSTYYKVDSVLIRVSDHFATSICDPETLNIVVNSNDFVVIYGNRPISINNYTELKNFLKYFILMGSAMKSFIPKEAKKKKIKKKEEKKEVVIIKEVPQTIDLSSLSKKQSAKIRQDIANYWGTMQCISTAGLTESQIKKINQKINDWKKL